MFRLQLNYREVELFQNPVLFYSVTILQTVAQWPNWNYAVILWNPLRPKISMRLLDVTNITNISEILSCYILPY